MNWVVAIPSYKRPTQLQKKTLTTLHNGKVPASRIFVFVVSEDEAEYKAALDPEYYNKIVVGKVGLVNQRDFIMDYFPKNKLIIFVDDDINAFVYRESEKKLVEIHDLPALFTKGFEVMKKEGANIWGIAAAANPFYMKAGHSVNLKYLIGAFYGIKNTKNPAYKLKYGDNQEDKERTLRYWKHDKVLVRFNDVSVKTAFYAPGGILAVQPDRIKKTKEATEEIVNEFPEYITQTYKKAKGMYDLKFRTGKIATAGGSKAADDTGIHALPIRNKVQYDKVKEKLLDVLHNTTIPAIKGGLPGSGPGRGDVIGRIGRTMTLGYGMRTFKGYGEFISNKKYPELFKLLVDFGNLVVPKDWTYETITLNEGVKAKKHKDSKNSGDSIIIGIGAFTGGDIRVWDADDKHPKVYNLHDQPLMFNGATHYHQTMPFKGERYTMIFYKQKKHGTIEGISMVGGEETEDAVGGTFA